MGFNSAFKGLILYSFKRFWSIVAHFTVPY